MNSERSSADSPPVITIDGPAASGKGTIAAGVAAALGFHRLDSGALYRLVGCVALREGVDMADETALAPRAATPGTRFVGPDILLQGENVTDAIRAEAVSAAASRVAVHGAVRAALLDRQRAFRE